jgi:GTP-binding protein
MRRSDEFFVKNKTEFLIGAVKVDDIPKTRTPEFAFAGRSNVGKSSLINAIVNDKIAITSKLPGRTKQLNFFTINNKVNFVDLPGYGYAKAEKKEVKNWTKFTFDYLLGRPNLKRLFLLIDSRHGLKKNDEDIMKILNGNGVLYQIILTKIDKISEIELEKVKASIEQIANKHTAMFPEILATSSAKGVGISRVRETIFRLI